MDRRIQKRCEAEILRPFSLVIALFRNRGESLAASEISPCTHYSNNLVHLKVWMKTWKRENRHFLHQKGSGCHLMVRCGNFFGHNTYSAWTLFSIWPLHVHWLNILYCGALWDWMNTLNNVHYGFVHHFKWLYSALDKGIEANFEHSLCLCPSGFELHYLFQDDIYWLLLSGPWLYSSAGSKLTLWNVGRQTHRLSWKT